MIIKLTRSCQEKEKKIGEMSYLRMIAGLFIYFFDDKANRLVLGNK